MQRGHSVEGTILYSSILESPQLIHHAIANCICIQMYFPRTRWLGQGQVFPIAKFNEESCCQEPNVVSEKKSPTYLHCTLTWPA